MKKPNAKQRILDTASKLFHQKGYATVGINEIIAKAETAKATFYQHYPSKQALGEAWLQTVHDRSEDSRSDILADQESARMKIHEYFQGLRLYLKNGNFRGCPYTNTSAIIPAEGDDNKPLRCQVVDHKKSIRKFFRDLAQGLTKDKSEAKRAGDILLSTLFWRHHRGAEPPVLVASRYRNGRGRRPMRKTSGQSVIFSE